MEDDQGRCLKPTFASACAHICMRGLDSQEPWSSMCLFCVIADSHTLYTNTVFLLHQTGSAPHIIFPQSFPKLGVRINYKFSERDVAIMIL